MRLVVRALIVAMGIIPLFNPAVARASSPLVIGEVAWAGSSASLADEWIEIWNLGNTDVSLAGYALTGASDNGKPIHFPDGATIPARGAYLVSNYAADNTKSALDVSPGLVTSTVSLSNSALGISIVDPNGVEIDRAGDGHAPPAGSTGDVKATMIRDGDVWVTATISSGFDSGRTDLGTPGTCDGCTSVTETPPPIVEEPPPVDENPPADPIATTTDPIVPETVTTTSTEDVATTSTDPVPEPPVAIDASTSSGPLPLDETTDVASSIDATLTAGMDTATSTDHSLEPEDTASTDMTTETAYASSTGTVATSTASIVDTNTTADAAPTASTVVTDGPQTTSPPRYDLLRLNEVMPQPDGEAEWIEITTMDPSVSVPLAGVALHDAVGKIYSFATGTVDEVTPFVRAALSSSRLNNGGDSVSILSPDGVSIDSLTYDGSEKGHPWAREDDATGSWKLTLTPTPGLANIITEPEDTPEATTAVAETPAVQTTVTTVPIVPIAAAVSLPDPAPKPVTTTKTTTGTATTAKTTTKQPATKKTTTTPTATTTKTTAAKTASASTAKKTTATVKKATAPKTTTVKSDEPIPITIDMTSSDTYRGIRVTLQGTVGSPSGLLSIHGFILLAPDGRGILVHVPTAQKLPAQDETVRITGTLQFDDLDVPSLKLGTKDGWTALPEKSPAPAPRNADLLAPGTEDRWSLMAATGTVVRIQGTNITIDVDDAEIVVAIRKVVDYRASRLAVGDTVRVVGLLDMSGATPRILPRLPDEIELLAHAAPKADAAAKPTLPGWTPFGAAGLAIAGTEGIKQLRERQKRRGLEKMLETGLNDATNV